MIQEYSGCLFIVLDCLEDKRKVIEVCDTAFDEPVVDREDYIGLLQKWDAAADFILAYNDGIAGYAIIYANDFASNSAYIAMIAVRPECQRQNIGRNLLMTAQRIAAWRGMEEIRLEVRIGNKKARCFYEENGFSEGGKKGTDSMYMAKRIWP